MHFSSVASLDKRKPSELLVIPFWTHKKKAEKAAPIGGKLSALIESPIKHEDFSGKEGEVLIVYGQEKHDKRIALLGLGDKEKITTEKLRRAYSNLAKKCNKRKIKEINVLVPHESPIHEENVIRGIAEGLLLANYAFTKLKHDVLKDQPASLLKHATLIGIEPAKLAIAKKAATIAESVYFARDLINSNADEVTPQYLEQVALNLAKTLPHTKATAFTKKQMEKDKMGLILAVNRGAAHDPAFIILEYKGNPKSKDHTILVGKGVTYDTGGLNLKPTGSMETMKCDMSGAATVLGTIQAIAKLGLKVNVTGVIPSVENCITSTSYKPGDVYVSYAGKTVEIDNTDAEGRLILADALAYACKNLKPDRIIDFATLTGAMVVALGNETTGFMSNNDVLADSLVRASSETFERIWRMPLYEEYRDQLKSEFADIKNSGGRAAGSITAALFLQEFVGKTPWAHLDIAGTAYLPDARRYNPKLGTGVGIRLMVEFLENL